ncbi:MAG: iron uptake porin [Synechococcaceae cyanobacterium]|nr:iron uptake porin [Synechococcaceae cyanobacterium]
MKLFQQLVLASAATGLLAPVAAQAADLNLAGVNQYAGAEEQVTSINQFSDVKPTDWAYQALSNLIERYGCVAGYPNGTYKGSQAMTRYEAAALLNACLDRITEVTDELKRLMKEFEKELAVLRGRVDGLEAKVGELEATQFSTTTKLKGIATFTFGANSFGGDAKLFSKVSFVSGYKYSGRYGSGVAGSVFNGTVKKYRIEEGGGRTLLYTSTKTRPVELDGFAYNKGTLVIDGKYVDLDTDIAQPFRIGKGTNLAPIVAGGSFPTPGTKGAPTFKQRDFDIIGLEVIDTYNGNTYAYVYDGTIEAIYEGNGLVSSRAGAKSKRYFGLDYNQNNYPDGTKGKLRSARYQGGFLGQQLFGYTCDYSYGGHVGYGGYGKGGYGKRGGGKYSKDCTQATITGQGATVFNYDLKLAFDTSFTGKDLLRTRLRAGNYQNGPWGNQFDLNAYNLVGLNALEVFQNEGQIPNNVIVDRLFYQFPIGSSFTATVGGVVRQDDMLAMWPSAYPADTILDIFTYAGAPGAYNLNLGSGAGLWWKSGGFSISAAYVAANGNVGDPNVGGIGTNGSQQSGTFQAGYVSPSSLWGGNWGLAAAYTWNSNGASDSFSNEGNFGAIGRSMGTTLASYVSTLGVTNSFGLSGYWSPVNSGWVPSISAGWGINSTSYKGLDYDLIEYKSWYDEKGSKTNLSSSITSQSWYVGLQWQDAFIKGNAAGMAVGQSTFVTGINNSLAYALTGRRGAFDGNYAWEWWYKFQVTDNISVTPAIFYLSQPLGQLTPSSDFNGNNMGSLNNFGGLVKTTFKF